MEEKTKEILALAWSLFNTPLWEARQSMQNYLEKNFEIRTQALPQDEGINGRMPTYF